MYAKMRTHVLALANKDENGKDFVVTWPVSKSLRTLYVDPSVILRAHQLGDVTFKDILEGRWKLLTTVEKLKHLKNKKSFSFSHILIKGADLEIFVFNGKPSPRVPPLGGGPYVLGMPAALGCPFWRNCEMRGSEKPSGHATWGGRCGNRRRK